MSINEEIEVTAKQRQIRRIVDFLNTHETISQRQADDISVKRLASRIHDMKRMGFVIGSKMVYGKNKYGENDKYKIYWLEG